MKERNLVYSASDCLNILLVSVRLCTMHTKSLAHQQCVDTLSVYEAYQHDSWITRYSLEVQVSHIKLNVPPPAATPLHVYTLLCLCMPWICRCLKIYTFTLCHTHTHTHTHTQLAESTRYAIPLEVTFCL